MLFGRGGSGRGWRPRLSPGSLGGRLGLLVVGLGLLVIGLGWNGAAGAGGQIDHVTDLRAQLPWLLSGGFLGLALVVLGAALLVVQAQREDRGRLEDRLEELIAVTARRAAADVPPRDLADLVVAGAASYHLPACRLVDGRTEVDYLTRDEAADRGLRPCRVCTPDGVPAEPR